MVKILRAILGIASWFGLGAIILLVLFVVGSNYNVFSGYRSYLVQSGSMEPAIMTGDIIIIHSQPEYYLRDVVTFRSSDGRTVTHRIAEVSKENSRLHFATKGDANRSQDEDVITSDQILGKVALIIPKLGYLVSFSKSLPGLIILAIIPAVFFIIDELLKIKNA